LRLGASLPAFLRAPRAGLPRGTDFRLAMSPNLPGLGAAVKAVVRKCVIPTDDLCSSFVDEDRN
jgi:hypothetical protein